MRELDPDLRELRSWDAAAAPLTDEARHRVRVRLFAVMNESTARPVRLPRRGRLVPRIALAGAVAAAVTATLLVTSDGEGRPPGAPAPERLDYMSASTVLDRAAAREKTGAKRLAPRKDQYIYTRTIGVAEGSGKRYVAESWHAADPYTNSSWVSETGEKPHEAEPLKPGQTQWPVHDWAALEKLPRDPAALLAAVRKAAPYDEGEESTPEGRRMLFDNLARLLRNVQVLPDGLRPAAYRAMATIPGVKATRGVEDIEGRRGVGVFFAGANDLRTPGVTFVFDEKTYAYLGDCREWKGQRCVVGSYLDDYAVTDKAKQRP
ncbi:CU044_5270 family protein [Streptomyces sp. I05A-00742]|uniref:CU044_5270 family protein n=1 Tax=Streptomyces sp. I05A-00742 TaxID=2732853 RepID=UPI001487A968|nr:CU044_5270 family protein [Streptomyces sp. I05A-00742]